MLIMINNTCDYYLKSKWLPWKKRIYILLIQTRNFPLSIREGSESSYRETQCHSGNCALKIEIDGTEIWSLGWIMFRGDAFSEWMNEWMKHYIHPRRRTFQDVDLVDNGRTKRMTVTPETRVHIHKERERDPSVVRGNKSSLVKLKGGRRFFINALCVFCIEPDVSVNFPNWNDTIKHALHYNVGYFWSGIGLKTLIFSSYPHYLYRTFNLVAITLHLRLFGNVMFGRQGRTPKLKILR